jgi:hypothetical protein
MAEKAPEVLAVLRVYFQKKKKKEEEGGEGGGSGGGGEGLYPLKNWTCS